MLNTLEMTGYVARVAESKRFRLSLKAAELGLHAIGQADLREVARPILRSLVGEVNEAASLGVLDGGDILYIERVRAGVARLGVDIRIGTTVPASHSIIGHALLAYLPPSDRERALTEKPRAGAMPPLTIPRKPSSRVCARYGSSTMLSGIPTWETDCMCSQCRCSTSTGIRSLQSVWPRRLFDWASSQSPFS